MHQLKRLYTEFKQRRFIDFFIDLVDNTSSYIFVKMIWLIPTISILSALYAFASKDMNLDLVNCYHFRDNDTVKIDYKAQNDMNILGMQITDYVIVIRSMEINSRSCLGSVPKELYDSYVVGETSVFPLAKR